jgi:hypothetical protein
MIKIDLTPEQLNDVLRQAKEQGIFKGIIPEEHNKIKEEIKELKEKIISIRERQEEITKQRSLW